jgi:hypothetical protein
MPKMGLVLQGGGALGAYEYGAVTRLVELGWQPVAGHRTLGGATATWCSRNGANAAKPMIRTWETAFIGICAMPPPGLTCSYVCGAGSIADKIGTSRHVINRELQGLENISARRIGEFFWAIGWEPHFEAQRAPDRRNDIMRPTATAPLQPERNNRRASVSALQEKKRDEEGKITSAAEMAYAE